MMIEPESNGPMSIRSISIPRSEKRFLKRREMNIIFEDFFIRIGDSYEIIDVQFNCTRITMLVQKLNNVPHENSQV